MEIFNFKSNLCIPEDLARDSLNRGLCKSSQEFQILIDALYSMDSFCLGLTLTVSL